jgi:universal stress protein A
MATTKATTVSPATKRKRKSTRRKKPTSNPDRAARLGRTPSLKQRTILVPVDFSDHSRAALNYAVTLARDFGGSLMILHVLDPLLASGRFDDARLRQLKASTREDSEERLQTLSGELVPPGLPKKLLIRRGPATDVIVALAGAIKIDLIIMGSQGLTGLRRLLIGSVAERVVRHAPCPVLVVR